MAQVITRIYANAAAASAAVAALSRAGYARGSINVVEPPAEPGDDDGVVEAIARGRILTAWARTLAHHVRGGGTLVTVIAPFGGAQRAIFILEEHEPIASGDPPSNDRRPMYDEAAPLSSSFGWTLISHRATPVSDVLGVDALAKNQGPTLRMTALSKQGPMLGGGTLSRGRFILGDPGVLNSAAPLSSALGLKVLSSRQ
jgi:hypothetical protein